MTKGKALINNPQNSLLPALTILVLFVVIGLLAATYQAGPGFSYKPGTALQSSQNFIAHNEELVFFFSKTILNRNKTQLTIPHGYSQPAPILLAGFTPINPKERIDILFSHPQLNNLDWSYISNNQSINQLHLYQRQQTYKTFDEFINNPPTPNKLAIDQFLVSEYPLFKTSTITTQPLDIESLDFILTTYTHPTPVSDHLVSKSTIDVSSARINDNDEIEWYIKQIQSENRTTYYLGNIDIEYLQ